MQPHRNTLTAFALGLALGAGPASALDERTQMLASTCFNCHGPDGKSQHAIPGLAGLDKAHLLQAMMECKTGVRQTTVMQKYMLGYTDAELEKLAEYFASLKH